MKPIPEFLRQLKAIFRPCSSPEMKQIYTNFLREKEDSRVTMLHREDLYMPGSPNTECSPYMIDLVRKHAGHEILDIGCGTGVKSIELLKTGFHCTGIETDPSYVNKAKKHFPAFVMNAEELDFPDKSFDTTILIEVLEHIRNPTAALSEIVRVTRKNLVLSVPNISALPFCVEHHTIMHHFFDSSHVNFFTPPMLKRFLEQFFPDVQTGEFGQFFNLSGKKLFYHIYAIASF